MTVLRLPNDLSASNLVPAQPTLLGEIAQSHRTSASPGGGPCQAPQQPRVNPETEAVRLPAFTATPVLAGSGSECDISVLWVSAQAVTLRVLPCLVHSASSVRQTFSQTVLHGHLHPGHIQALAEEESLPFHMASGYFLRHPGFPLSCRCIKGWGLCTVA